MLIFLKRAIFEIFIFYRDYLKMKNAHKKTHSLDLHTYNIMIGYIKKDKLCIKRYIDEQHSFFKSSPMSFS